MSKATIHQFYIAFQALDAEKMASCYHPNVEFRDPAFGSLKGEHASNMWRMLLQNQKDKGMEIKFMVTSDDSASWEAIYLFPKTGRKIHNKIYSYFEFEDGLIIKHYDNFNLHKWAAQALGITGLLLGWTPFFQKKLQRQCRQLLKRFEKPH